MADTNEAARKSVDDVKEAMQKEITSLKRQVTRLTRQLSEQAEEVAESGWYDGAGERAVRATQALKTQAQSVAETVRENPGTVSSAMLLGGLAGIAIGLLLGQSDGRRWWER